MVPVVLSHATQGWHAPRSPDAMLPAARETPALRHLQPRLELTVVDISTWSNGEIKRRVVDTFTRLVLWVLRDGRSPERLLANLQHWSNAFIDANAAPDGMRSLAILLRYLWRVTEHLHFEEFRDRLVTPAPTTEPTLMTIAEQLDQRGRRRAAQEILADLLEAKFGAVTEAD